MFALYSPSATGGISGDCTVKEWNVNSLRREVAATAQALHKTVQWYELDDSVLRDAGNLESAGPDFRPGWRVLPLSPEIGRTNG